MFKLESKCECGMSITIRRNTTMFCENCKKEHGDLTLEVLINRVDEKVDEAGLRNLIQDFTYEVARCFYMELHDVVELYRCAKIYAESKIRKLVK